MKPPKGDRTRTPLRVLLLVSLFIVSCFHGSHKNTGRPSLISSGPENDASGVALNTAVVAKFSKAMDSNTVTTATFVLMDSNHVLVNGSVLLSGTSALFVPSTSLTLSTTYIAEVTTGAKDLEGNALAGNYTWSFTTEGVSSENLSPFGFHPAEIDKTDYANNGYTDALAIGVTWDRPSLYAFWSVVQPDLSKQAYDFSQYDPRYGTIPAGVNIVVNISPGPDNSSADYTVSGSYLPADESKYMDFVKAFVERYDGDGVSDMPGLNNPVKYWQVGNEPSALDTGFAVLQRMTYIAIKEACPDCMVLIGGVPGMPPASAYIADFDTTYKPIFDELGGKYVDIMDFHWYGNATGDYRAAKDVNNHIRSVMDAAGFAGIPIWITEMGSYSGQPVPAETSGDNGYPPQTERDQALDYVKRFVYSLSFGVKKIFPAFGLMEGYKNDDGYFDYTGLIYDGGGVDDPGPGVKKLGYYSFKKMTEKLEGLDVHSVQAITETDNVFVYRITKNGKFIYVAWWDYFSDPLYEPDLPFAGQLKRITLTDLTGATVLVSEALPLFSTGREVADYSAAFSQETRFVSSGTLDLGLGDSPVYIEEQ